MWNLKNNLNIAFAGGSTGGHVVPISTLIQELKLKARAKDFKIFWFGEKGNLEERECGKLNNIVDKGDPSIRQARGFQGSVGMTANWWWIRFVPIVSGKLRRKPNVKEWIQNILDLFKFLYGVFLSLFYLKRHSIDVVFSKWWFVSLPVVIAAWILRLPIIVHESDSKAGISTKIAARFATKVFTGFPGVLEGGEYVGQILSGELLPVGTHGNASDNSNIYDNGDTDVLPHVPTILVNCGSQGSASVHKTLLELFAKDTTLTERFHWIVLLGVLNAWFASDYKKYPNIELYDFIDQTAMGDLYARADISVCRGGSTSLVEQHTFGIKQIIIPIPWTHDQMSNAEFFVKEYGDILLDQNIPHRWDELWNNLKKLVGYKKQKLNVENTVKKLARGREEIVKCIISRLESS